MALFNLIEVSVDETSANVTQDLVAETGLVELAGLKLKNFIKQITSGIHPAVVKVRANAVKASGTFTFVSVVATDVITINGVTFTCMASGATGDQFNVGASDTLTAANAAAAINASATALISETVVASSALGVLTITALVPGSAGNAITISTVDSTVTPSGARLTGGTNGSSAVTHYYGSAS